MITSAVETINVTRPDSVIQSGGIKNLPQLFTAFALEMVHKRKNTIPDILSGLTLDAKGAV